MREKSSDEKTARRRLNLTPYLLLLPSMLYLLLFFAYPMVQAFQLALSKNVDVLNLRAEPNLESPVTGSLAMQTVATVLERERSEEVLPTGVSRAVFWFKVEAPDLEGDLVQGWVSQRNIFIENRTESQTLRVTTGEPTRVFTTEFISRMVNDFRFLPALGTTILLAVLILPIQFTLAIIIGLVLQSQIRGSSLFLYIYAIPLGVSDLTAGIVWYSVFTQQGFLNSALVTAGILERPFIFLQASNTGWMITAVVIAEVWRATSLVMVIVVAGLQAIPREYLEAGEVFGATVWQRLTRIILPLLKPSLQVALILRTILAFQVFAVLVAITGGNVLTVLGNETFRWYDPGRFNNPNVAATYAGFILLISLAISFFYLRAVRGQEEALKNA
ncbi:MAG: ABC transporter permease subunit [Chloroflexi bacterium CFX4]|nr:ABC transporter permease subunit [Chloroflexi bacterium CFX4]MDL1923783.1 ABC transporter permease subunit [Chloroflexi bacterium CFX3]